MGKIRLDSRLSAVASLVRNGSRVADIGTDHGYLIAYLIENGISPSGVAADLREGPLNNAKQTVIEQGISDKVELVLSDGLKKISANSCEDIVIAGMGGNLIADILSACEWIYDKKFNIVAQPMSHAEVLREFYINNGFEIKEEKTATDGKHIYCVMSASYTGKKKEREKSYIYLGELTKNNDEITRKCINKLLTALEKKHNALIAAEKQDADSLGEIISQIKMKVTEVYNGNC